MTTSLIISTYNWPEALKLVAQSAMDQSLLPGEILIADDGSGPDTRRVVEELRSNAPVPVRHIWHEDKGFRLSEIRNRAIAAAAGEYLIQVDGDTILHRDFIKNHVNLAKKDTFLSGSRVLLGELLSENILKTQKAHISPFTKGLTNRFNALPLPMLAFRCAKKEPVAKLIFKVRGCNMSFWKADLIEVNGYNEDIIGWGREDSEIALRLLKKGLSLRKIKNAGIQYHLYHTEAGKKSLDHNTLLLQQAMEITGYRTKNGIIKL